VDVLDKYTSMFKDCDPNQPVGCGPGQGAPCTIRTAAYVDVVNQRVNLKPLGYYFY